MKKQIIYDNLQFQIEIIKFQDTYSNTPYYWSDLILVIIINNMNLEIKSMSPLINEMFVCKTNNLEVNSFIIESKCFDVIDNNLFLYKLNNYAKLKLL